MDRKKMVVCYRNSPLVIIEETDLLLPLDVLMWYAKTYASELRHLTWTCVDTVVCQLKHLPSPYSAKSSDS